MRGISKKQLLMGEVAWAEYQRLRKLNKAHKHNSQNARKVVEWRRRAKLRLIAYKGGKCESCGYDKPFLSCYDFHHKDPSQKDFTISGKSRSFERLKEEADKCSLLCKNCHYELHDVLYGKQSEKTIEDLRV